MKTINIIGGGLAGSEAALQLSKRNWQVNLFEMRPQRSSPVHHTDLLGELICSNSLKSNLLTTASGLLKEELKLLDCELLKIAYETSVAAGNALAVDRILFAQELTRKIASDPNINLNRVEVESISNELTIVATGPLTSRSLTEYLQQIIGYDNLSFYDAIAPIISAESIDYDVVFEKTRYDKGEPDYLNCPFSKEEYLRFYEALINGEKYFGKEEQIENSEGQINTQKLSFYENCIPIEELARRGVDSLRFGVMKPVGLENPRTGLRPYAVVQLRSENKDRTAFNLVGCQTMLSVKSQKEVFRLIPGLHNAEFYRYGSIHRNTYINAPSSLSRNLSLKKQPNVFIGGQLSGLEGYVESISSGLLVALIIADNLESLPETTILGQFWRALTTIKEQPFTPVNANFGLLPPLIQVIKDKKVRKTMLTERSLDNMHTFLFGMDTIQIETLTKGERTEYSLLE